jgi:hypothetical protein
MYFSCPSHYWDITVICLVTTGFTRKEKMKKYRENIYRNKDRINFLSTYTIMHENGTKEKETLLFVWFNFPV